MNKKSKAAGKWVLATVCCALIVFAIPLLTQSFRADEAETVVILLDPGHGGSDTGAVNYRDGLYESELNLQIAKACCEELGKYSGVEVYMTHSGLDYSAGKLSLGNRVRMAKEVGADILISLHCNDSSSPTASGAEVYVSHSTYKKEFNQQSTELAISFLNQFRNIGMNVRGVKTRLSNGARMYHHDDGTSEVGDYYAVIGDTIKYYGIPGILVEHAFVTGDAQHLNTPEKLRMFGIADAHAIADYFGLREGGTSQSEPKEEVRVATDEDIMAASEVTNSIVSLPLDAAAWTEEQLRAVKDGYEDLNPTAKTLVDQEMMTEIYKKLLDIEFAKHPLRMAVTDESDLEIDRIDGFLKGLDVPTATLRGQNVASVLAELQTYIDVNHADASTASLLGVEIRIVDSNFDELDIGAQVTTGDIVLMVRGEEVLDRLDVVLEGDIDGDGVINSYDQLMLDSYLASLSGQPSEYQMNIAQKEACDVNGDGRVSAEDVESLVELIVKVG